MSRYKIYRALSIPLSLLLFTSSCSLESFIGVLDELDKAVSSSVSKTNDKEGSELFNNINPNGLSLTPKCNPQFTIKEPTYITMIETVHEKGTIINLSGNTIMLADSKGTTYGPWNVDKISGASNYYRVYPKITLPAGTYTILDSETVTQYYNTDSGGCGFARVLGYSDSSSSNIGTTIPNTTVSKPSGSFSSGSETTVLNKTVTSSGGTITVESDGSPIDGLSITVPQNAYSDTRNFEVSYAPIKENNFGKYVNPITPMITIKNGGGYSDEPMTVKIPIKKNSDEFAMAFYYDAKKGKLEGIPIVDEDDNSITIETKHFASSNMSTSSFKTKGLADGIGNLFVSSIKESILKQSPIISTGFKPGVDDWDFQNHGSFVTPRGHCAGQSVASIWYYYEKKLEGSPSLHSLYDNQDSLWFDNPKGYKFSSTLQKIYGDNFSNVNNSTRAAQEKQYELSSKYGALSWKAFALSMLVTGEPQMVAIRRFDVNGNVAGGHALVAYKIDYSNGKLYVVDPNFESQFNEDRYIEFDGNKLLPYTSSEKVGQAGRTYTLISYWAKSSFIDYYGIAEQYNKLSNNTIGNEYFPDVDYYYYDEDGNQKPLTDEITSSIQNIKISAIASPKSGISQDGTLTVIRGKDVLNNEEIKPEITLKSGDNLIGIYVQATSPNSNSLEWTDFKYVNIKYADLSIQPSVTNGVPNQEYTWKLQSGLPANTIYEWTFGDSSDESVIGALPVSHKYENEGTYTITVTAKDPKNNKEIGSASATAEIKNTTVSKYPKVTAAFKADVYTDPFIESSGGSNIPMLGASNYRGDTIMGPLSWNGDNFSTVYQNTDSSITRIEGLAMTTTIKGSIDFATNTLKSIYVNNTTTMDGKVSSVTGFSAKDVPLELNGTYYEADIAGEEVEKYITSIDVGYKSVNWSNARLQIYFKEK